MSRFLPPLLVAAALASCAAPPELAPARPAPPPELASCPGSVVVPPAPKVPRTLESIVAWAFKTDAALVRSEAARAECARRLERLNSWAREQ